MDTSQNNLSSNVITRTAVAAVVGGTASALGGGKFANDAYTAAFQHLFNAEGGVAKAAEARRRHYARKMQRGIADGHLTLEEANYHYRNSNGTPLSVDANKLDLSGVDMNGFRYHEASGTYRQLYTFKTTGSNWHHDFVVHGTVTLERVGQSSYSILSGDYDFDLHSYRGGAIARTKTFMRNQETKIADFVADGPGSRGSSYVINYQGVVNR